MKSNSKGHSTVLGLCFFTLINSMLILLYYQINLSQMELKKKTQLYKCFHSLNKKQNKYIKTIFKTNKLISFFYKASALPPPIGPGAKKTHQALIYFQTALHISYMKNLIKNNTCNYLQRSSYIINFPFKTFSLVQLKRKVNGEAILKNKSWHTIVPQEYSIQSPTIRANYKIAKSKLLIHAKEDYYQIEDLQRLKLSFGSLFLQ